MYKNGIKVIALAMLIVSHKCFPVAIIFDIDSFLITEDTKKRLWEVGPTNFIGWYNPITVKEDYFKALDTLMPHRADSPIVIRDGYVLPQIINDWLANIQSAHEIKHFVINGLKDMAKKQGKNTKISQAIADYVFSPERYSRTMMVQKKAKSILKKCCARKDSAGKKVNKVCCQTNWNKESWDRALTHKKIRKAVSYFDYVVISGEAHLLKPDPAFLQYAFQKFNLTPGEKIIYVDGEINNIKIVQSLNIPNLYCIHCKDLNFKHVEKELKRLGALSPN